MGGWYTPKYVEDKGFCTEPCVDNDKQQNPICDGGRGRANGGSWKACANGHPESNGEPSAISCWAYSYRYQLNKSNKKLMIQVKEANANGDFKLGGGQIIEEAMANEDHIHILPVYWKAGKNPDEKEMQAARDDAIQQVKQGLKKLNIS